MFQKPTCRHVSGVARIALSDQLRRGPSVSTKRSRAVRRAKRSAMEMREAHLAAAAQQKTAPAKLGGRVCLECTIARVLGDAVCSRPSTRLLAMEQARNMSETLVNI